MRTEISFAPIAGIATELLAVLAIDTQTEKGPEAKPRPTLLTTDAAVLAAAASVLSTGEYKAGANETVLLHAPAGLAAKRLLIVGLGKLAKATVHSRARCRGNGGAICEAARDSGGDAGVAGEFREGLGGRTGEGCGGGRVRGRLRADTYRSDRKDQSIQTFTLALRDACGSVRLIARLLRRRLRRARLSARARILRAALVNEPGNKLTPTILGQQAAQMAQEVGLGWEVHSTEKLHELKMGAFWSVSQGSPEPPALIVLRYEPEGVKEGPCLASWGRELRLTPAASRSSRRTTWKK